ncbi:MAG: hypothetical protein OXF56_07875 [Rhodobacteraceae bacterium]|nr:hypothetical protein [Paracoccaceae bacterium]
MTDRDSDGKGGNRNSDRDLLLGRVSRPGSSRKPAAPSYKGNAPSGQADSALLRENVQRVDGLVERTAALEEALRESSSTLERIAPAIDEIVQNSGDLSRELSKATDELSKVLPRLDGIDGKMTDAAEVMSPLLQDLARLEDRIGELARALESREPGGAADNSDTVDQVRLLGEMLTVRMDEVGRNLDGIRTKISSADPFASTQKRISRQDKEIPPPVLALAVPDPADPAAMERAVGVLGDLHKRIGIGLFVLEQALPEADRRHAIAEFRHKHRDGRRRRWLRRLGAVTALVIVTAWIEATWYPFGRLFAWTRYLTGWPL